MTNWKQVSAAKAILVQETGTIHKDHGGRLTVALTYPNSYRVGMSSLGLQILYRAFNRVSNVVCERVFWDERFNAAGMPLLSLESQTPVRDFAVWAFTIPFEMDYFNVLAMLRAAGVPPLAAERARAAAGKSPPARYPLLIAGGPGIAANPEPMALFFDAIVIGEAEELLPVLIETFQQGMTIDKPGGPYPINREHEQLLDALDAIAGIYVPSRVSPVPGGRRIERLWVQDMNKLEPISCLYTPATEFANQHLIEIARGCGRGCRFCLAGYVYRPPREQPLARVVEWAREGTSRLGGARRRGEGERGRRGDGKIGRRATVSPRLRVGLVSAAVSDYSEIDALANELQDLGIRISVSSMRTDPISAPLLRWLAASGTRCFTIAPEAGTERLRHIINKNQTEANLLAAIELAQALSFPQLKLYFMVGHPAETDDDVQGIVDLTLKARAIFRRNITINATPFVPKAHTPFQWAAMTPARTLAERQKKLKLALAKHQVTVSADSPDWAEMQAVLARGDRRLAPALLEIDRVSPHALRKALARHGLSMDELLAERDPSAFMPWEVVDTGLRLNHLRRERALAAEDAASRGCPPAKSPDVCLTCGVCNVSYRMNRQ